jgi:hypothetical protein
MKRLPLRFALPAALVAAGLLSSTRAPSTSQDDDPPVLPEELIPSQNGADEMLKLFHNVERNLRKIDSVLTDAGAGDTSLAEVPDSGLDDLLRNTRDMSQQVVADINRILEIAQNSGQGSGMGQQPQPSQGESPLDKPQDGQLEREQTPDAPQPHPQEEGEQQQSQGENRPEDNHEDSDDPGQNRPGGTPPESEEGPPSDARDADVWGKLPKRTQDVFRNQGRDELPVEYRDWIDTYYRRLNQDG